MKQIPNNIDSLRLLHEILFALNIGLATAFALRTYIDLPRQQWLAERFHLWADKLLGLQENNDAWVRIQFVGTMLGSAAIVFLLLILLRAGPRPLHRAILDPLACALALAAAPALWIAAILIGGPPDHWWNGYPAWPGQNGFWFLGIEATLAYVFLQIAVRWKNPIGWGVLILVGHYGIWACYLWPAMSHELWPFSSFSWLQTFAIATPCSGLTWLLYAVTLRERKSEGQLDRKVSIPKEAVNASHRSVR